MNTHRSPRFLLASKIMILLFMSGVQVFGEEKPSPEKIAQIRTAAAGGDADSQFQLADIYRYGKGVKKDYRESFEWAQKAANQGNAQAQHHLGIFYTYGMGVKKDLPEAFKWFQKAAEQGFVNSQYRVGKCYYNAAGVPKDDRKAISWMHKAAKAGDGDTEAMEALGLIYEHKSKKEFEDVSDRFSEYPSYRSSQREAYMWYNVAAANGAARAKESLQKLSASMSAEDIAQAQKMSSDLKAGKLW